MKKRYTEEQIIGFLGEADAGLPIKELCRRHGFSEGSFYLWRNKFGGMSVPDAKRLKELETENGRLKRLLANAMLESKVMKEAMQKKLLPLQPDASWCVSCQAVASVSGAHYELPGSAPVPCATSPNRIAMSNCEAKWFASRIGTSVTGPR